MGRRVPATAPARRPAEHRRVETHRRVEEASHICRERALCARLNASRTLGGEDQGPEETEASWSFSDRPAPSARILVLAGGLGASRRCPPRADESYELTEFVPDVLRQFC
jgi:hypothetical protein